MTDSIGDHTQTSEEFEYRVWVPVETPNSQTVTVQAGERGGTRLMHAESTDQSEYYFEILAYEAHKDHDPLIADQKMFLQKHSEDGTTSPTTAETLHHLKGTSFMFKGTLQNRWKERKFFFVDGPNRTYRIVHDPRSELNSKAFESLELFGLGD